MEKINTGVEQRLARANLKLMIENKMKFNIPADLKSKIKSMDAVQGNFTDNQLSYIDGLYEQYMKAGGFQSVGVKHDFKRKF